MLPPPLSRSKILLSLQSNTTDHPFQCYDLCPPLLNPPFLLLLLYHFPCMCHFVTSCVACLFCSVLLPYLCPSFHENVGFMRAGILFYPLLLPKHPEWGLTQSTSLMNRQINRRRDQPGREETASKWTLKQTHTPKTPTSHIVFSEPAFSSLKLGTQGALGWLSWSNTCLRLRS